MAAFVLWCLGFGLFLFTVRSAASHMKPSPGQVEEKPEPVREEKPPST